MLTRNENTELYSDLNGLNRAWESRLNKAKFVDLVLEIGSTNHFIIEGDSLILRCIHSKFQDWHHGGQILQLIYALERVLQYFSRRGEFKIVFFDQNRVLYDNSPYHYFAREIAKLHLSRNYNTYMCDSWLSSEWTEYLNDVYPPFVIADYDFFESGDKRTFMSSFIIQTLSVYNVLLLRGLKPKSRSVDTFCLEAGVTIDVNNFQEQIQELYAKSLAEFTMQEVSVKCSVSDAIHSKGGRFVLASEVLKKLVENDESVELAKVFCVHTVLLQHLPLNYRSQNLVTVDDSYNTWKLRAMAFLESFGKTALSILKSLESSLDQMFVDAFDGHLFMQTLFIVLYQHRDNLTSDYIEKLGFNDAMKADLNLLWSDVSSTPFSPIFKNVAVNEIGIPPVEEPKPVHLAKIESPLLTQIFSEPELEVDTYTDTQPRVPQFFDFADIKATKRRINEKDALKVEENEKKKARQKQQFYAFIEKYNPPRYLIPEGRSKFVRLSKDTTDAITEEETKTPQQKKPQKGKKGGKPGSGGGKKNGLSKKDLIIAKNKQNSAKDKEESDIKLLKTTKEDVRRLVDVAKRQDLLETRALSMKTKKYRLELLIFHAEYMAELWLRKCDVIPPIEATDFTLLVHCIRMIFDIFIDYSKDLSTNQIETLAKLLTTVGYKDVADQMLAYYEKPNELHKIVIDTKKTFFRVPLSPIRFQLMHMEHLMDRETDSKPDSRVKFWPDRWQRELLDTIDNFDSAVVSAPTSAGKTFISFYIMEKILKETRDGIVVYVTPSKALLNQVSAEVYSRFKNINLEKGALFGIAAPNYSQSLESCRILITVPEAFENLILSSDKLESWIPKIRYIIFDEVHCLNERDGHIWERLVLLSRSPFLAMSATISNGPEFASKIQSIDSSRTVKYIEHHQRFSELRKSVFDPNDNKIVPINPFGTMSNDILSQRFPNVSLTARETLEIYDAIVKSVKDNKKTLPTELNEALKELDPDVFYQYELAINQKKAKQYERKIKDLVVLLNKLDPHIIKSAIELFSSFKNVDCGKTVPTIKMIKELRKQNLLPSLFFNYTFGMVEKRAIEVIQYLLNEESKITSSKEYQKMLKENSKKAKDSKKKFEDIKNDERRAKEESQVVDTEAELDLMMDPRVTLTLSGEVLPVEDLERELEIVRRKTKRLNPMLIEGLRRGIGLHYYVYESKYLQAVEKLFRMGHLKVVFTSITLALGVNMPCKSVVFFQDSELLTSLQYQQMSGRAGRRGFDPVGDVIFYKIPHKKIRNLILSDVPRLKGQISLGPSLLTRTLFLINEVNKKNFKASLAISSNLLTKTLFLEGVEDDLKQLLRSSLNFLFIEGLIDREGKPINNAYLMSSLHESEPSNLVLNAVLCDEVLEKCCSNYQSDRRNSEKRLLDVLVDIFNRVYPMPAALKKTYDPIFLKSYEEYNRRVINSIVDYIKLCNKPYNATLPQSDISFAFGDIELSDNKDSLTGIMKQSIFKYETRSPFIALSGYNDDYKTGEEVIATARDDVLVNFDNVPVMQTQDLFGNMMAFSPLLYNFLMSSEQLKVNIDTEYAAYERVMSFMTFLEKLNNYLTTFDVTDKNVLDCMNKIKEDFHAKYSAVFDIKLKK